MKDKSRLRLGTRASNLALTQSRLVAALLEQAHRGLKVELVEIATTGDTVHDKPLQSFGGRGVFVKELENALLQRRIDLAVHSLKDLPTRQPRGLVLGAISRREDTRDVAVVGSGKKLENLPPGSVIGTGSPRRRAQLKARYPHLEFAEIRGNVETRLRKVHEGRFAGTILARAGLKRLGLLARVTQAIPHGVMLPAPGQGALAIECRAADKRVRRILRILHNDDVAACVTAERAALEALGGGCHLPLGALGTVTLRMADCGLRIARRRVLHLRAALGLPDGSLVVRAEDSLPLVPRPSPLGKARQLGRKVARAILARGGRELLARLPRA